MSVNAAGLSTVVDSVTAVVVDPTLTGLMFAVSPLSAAGFRVTTAGSFEEAKHLLMTVRPHVLVTAIRLGEYNGLHLVLRGKAERPDMAAVVTCPVADPVLMAEADGLRSTFVVTPTSEAELLVAVLRTISRSDADHPLRPPFERRLHERRHDAAEVLVQPERRQQDRRRASLSADYVPLVG